MWLNLAITEGVYIIYSFLYPHSSFSLLPAIFVASLPLSSFPSLPFPSLYRSGYFLPLPLVLSIPFMFSRGRNIPCASAFVYPLFFFIPIKHIFLPYIVFLSIISVRSIEEEIIYGEKFITTFVRILLFFIYLSLMFLLLFPVLRKDFFYIFLTLIIITTGLLLKSATILLRHKLLFVLYSFTLACFLLPAFG